MWIEKKMVRLIFLNVSSGRSGRWDSNLKEQSFFLLILFQLLTVSQIRTKNIIKIETKSAIPESASRSIYLFTPVSQSETVTPNIFS